MGHHLSRHKLHRGALRCLADMESRLSSNLDLELVRFHLALDLIFCEGGLETREGKERGEEKVND